MQRVIMMTCLSLAVSCAAAADIDARTDAFLHNYRHGYCPYVLSRETNLEEIKIVADQGFDAVGVAFAGTYNNGKIDWSKLDEAVEMLKKDGRKVVVHLFPRFAESEGVSDVLNTGKRITHLWNKSPNYSMLDIFDPSQKAKFCDYLALAAQRWGANPAVIGFVFGWGYQGETGFYNGDFLADFSLMGTECAGYSEFALIEYNRWRRDHGKAPIQALPQPSVERQTDDYIDWMHFRYWYTGEVFERASVDAIKAKTDKPVGTFAYLPASVENYARAWSFVPNADFFRSAGSASSFDNTRLLQDSAIGWEDAWLHDGRWNFSVKRMMCDEARMIAHGAAFHAMYFRGYDSEPQWESDVYQKISKFILTHQVRDQIEFCKPTVALFQPTWSVAALPARSDKQPFLPKVEHRHHIEWMVGLVESFGLPYRLVVEEDLMNPDRLKDFELIIVPMADVAPRFLGTSRAEELITGPRVLPIPLRSEPLTRSQLKSMLKSRGASVHFDYDGETPTAGRVNNLVFNWTPERITVRALWNGEWLELRLDANGYQILD